MIVSLAIAVRDKGGQRSNIGDIIAWKPAPWQWGIEERKRFLLLDVELPTQVVNTAFLHRLTIPYYADGSVDYPDDLDSKVATAKRRFAFKQAQINSVAASLGITIDWARLQDSSVEYQPFAGRTVTLQGTVTDKYNNRIANATDLRILRQ